MTPQAVRALLARGETAAALAASTAGVAGPDSAAWLMLHAEALRAAGRDLEAEPVLRRAIAASPASPVRRHNLAALLGDLGRDAEAETEARAALAAGGDAPETWLVLARALQGQNRFDEADAAYGEAIRRRPDYLPAVQERAQLVWMRTGQLAPAVAVTHHLPEAAATRRLVEAALHEAAGDLDAAFAACRRGPLDAALTVRSVGLGTRVDPAAALRLAEEALRTLGPQRPVLLALAEARLAAGDAAGAEAPVAAALDQDPADQYALGLLSTIWRLRGDPRYAALHDHEGLVSTQTLDTPPGWATLDAYLDDLAAALGRIHAFAAHPLNQSVRGGSQASVRLESHPDPAVRAFFAAIDGPIRRHIARTGPGDDPFRRRHTGDYRLAGLWSVRLTAGGSHVDHVHPRGWISSACYIDLPEAVAGDDRQGWLRFGRPPVVTGHDLPPERWVQPQRGLLALFPSYLWHGVQPFSEGVRLTIAFDVVPA